MSLIPTGIHLPVSGNRFRAIYHIQGNAETARARAEDICIEQTIEYPPELIPVGDIREHIFGRIESFAPLEDGYQAVISYADEISGNELPQLVNVLFGNISMKVGIRLMELDLSESLLAYFKGPRFGVSGLREQLGVPERCPLLATAIKPMGLSPAQLANMAYELALGGMDIIKDDHGLADQAFASFRERVLHTVAAVGEANAQSGRRTIYMPNVTGPFEIMLERIHYAKEAGAGGLMLIPGHCGLDFMRSIADDDTIDLPIMSHPAFIGSYVLDSSFGVSHQVMHGQLLRLAGADMSVFPNYIGRFASYSRADCAGIARGCAMPMGTLRPIFPSPGGGIDPDSFADMLTVYGPDVIFLMSSNLHRAGPDLAGTVRRFKEIISG